MGKYSLDAFEQYPLVKLRPIVTEPARSGYRLLELSWAELEPEAGDRLSPPEIGEGDVLLRLRLDTERDISEACGFVRRMGACYAGGKPLAGVVLTAGRFTGVAAAELVSAYRQGFEAAVLLAEPETELMELCRRAGILPGLWLPVPKGILPLRRGIARTGLERTWRSRPVYVWADRPLTPEELDAACRWHSSGADSKTALGVRMTLRRLMFPRDLTGGGPVPLRMWWQNLGTAPMYRGVRIRLELRDEAERYEIPVAGEMCPGLGDTTCNVTARLPEVPCGTYSLWIGLEGERGFLPLAMDAPSDGGMYRIGELSADDVDRPYLQTMWDEQYADGYYPLEDPAQPE